MPRLRSSRGTVASTAGLVSEGAPFDFAWGSKSLSHLNDDPL